MNMMKVLFFLLAFVPAIFAHFSFPVGTGRKVQAIFQGINPYIRWDTKNFLVDEAGPVTECRNVGSPGFIDIPKLTPEYLKSHGVTAGSVGGLADDTRMTSPSQSGATTDIIRMANSWLSKSPFREQIQGARSFGCSVLPACRDRTTIACLFTPSTRRNEQPPAQDTSSVGTGVVAFTPSEYAVTERVFKRQGIQSEQWDRTNFFENLSGRVTTCDMIGKQSWNYDKIKDLAAKYGKTVSLLFGWADKSGNTDQDVENITSQWTSHAKKHSQIAGAEEVGCSLIQDCGNGKTVVVCLVSPAHD